MSKNRVARQSWKMNYLSLYFASISIGKNEHTSAYESEGSLSLSAAHHQWEVRIKWLLFPEAPLFVNS